MGKYIAKRIGYMALVFLIVSFLMYSLYNLIPTDPARAELEAQKMSLKPAEYEQMYQQLRQKMGLDDPLVVRYMRWMGLWPDVDGSSFNGLLQGNFGYSQFFKKDVVDVISAPMGNTIFINIFSTILALGITIPLGIRTAVKKGSAFDQSMQVVTIVGHSLPQYIIGLIFIFIFAVKLRWFPVSGMVTANAGYTGMRSVMDRAWHYVLPLIVIVAANLGSMTRYVRAAMIDVLSMDYIRTARAKGLIKKQAIRKHALRASLIPTSVNVAFSIASIFTGAVMTEKIFAIHGMGEYFINCINNNNINGAVAVAAFSGACTLVGALLADLFAAALDPRIKMS